MTFAAVPSHAFLTTEGQDFDLFPVSSSELTVAQAADRLQFSENHLNDLLDTGRITSRMENGKRLIPLNCLLEYEQKRGHRHAALNDLFRMFQEAGMSDDEE